MKDSKLKQLEYEDQLKSKTDEINRLNAMIELAKTLKNKQSELDAIIIEKKNQSETEDKMNGGDNNEVLSAIDIIVEKNPENLDRALEIRDEINTELITGGKKKKHNKIKKTKRKKSSKKITIKKNK